MKNTDSTGIKAIEVIMDSMDFGVVYTNSEKRIELCNRKAKEITGIMIESHAAHESGQIEKGDIIVIADNKVGDDDGNLSCDELASLNINDNGIRQNDMLVAIGVYKNSKIEPQYKYIREHELNVPLKISANYLGFNITATVDTEKKETYIEVNDFSEHLPFFNSVGNMVVIDGKTGRVKFFQAKGYSVRNEEIGALLRGQKYKAKALENEEIDVRGELFTDYFNQSELTDKLFAALEGREEFVNNNIYDINKRPFICTIVPWREMKKVKGVFLIIQEAENLENLVESRNEIIKQLEEKHREIGESEQMYPKGFFDCFVGRGSRANEVKYMAYKASQNKFNVIITGESGTGKSLIAREIHKVWNPKAPFVEVNCNAIAPTLFESELFGYVGGAFTGAKAEGKTGLFEAANNGTIFLDEIGEIPLEIQVKLLHVLQNKIIYRVGSSKPIKVNVRVIAATNKNLQQEVLNGNFRQDLFYRINVFPIEIPPLRERKSDLYLMINQILEKTCSDYGMDLKQFSGEALQKMISYNWPGNVRELENVIERAVTLCETNIIYSEHLRIGNNNIPTTLKEMLAEEEKRIIETTMMKYNGDKQQVMKELDISKSVFYEKLKKFGI